MLLFCYAFILLSFFLLFFFPEKSSGKSLLNCDLSYNPAVSKLIELIALKTSAPKINPVVEMALYPEVLPAGWI